MRASLRAILRPETAAPQGITGGKLLQNAWQQASVPVIFSWRQASVPVVLARRRRYGAVWVFAGVQNAYGPLKTPAPDTASQKDYNTGSRWQPNRRTYQVATAAVEGDKRILFGQGRPMTKDASGTGSTWSTGTRSQPTSPFALVTVESRFEFQGTVAPTDMSRATDMREKDRTGIFGNSLSYAGSYSRVTSEALGRDINPLGRGDGMAYVGGWMNLGRIAPRLPLNVAASGSGGSVNNGCVGCDRGPLNEIPENDILPGDSPDKNGQVPGNSSGTTKTPDGKCVYTRGCCSGSGSVASKRCSSPACCNPCYGKLYPVSPTGWVGCDCRKCLWYEDCKQLTWCGLWPIAGAPSDPGHEEEHEEHWLEDSPWWAKFIVGFGELSGNHPHQTFDPHHDDDHDHHGHDHTHEENEILPYYPEEERPRPKPPVKPGERMPIPKNDWSRYRRRLPPRARRDAELDLQVEY